MQDSAASDYPFKFLDKLIFIHRCLRFRYGHQRQHVKKLFSYNLTGGQTLDIGGNHGIYSYFHAKAVGPTGHVHVFEPQPELVSEIRGVMTWLRINNVTVNPLAFSDKLSEQVLHRKSIGDGGATLEPACIRPDQNQELVAQTTTLDAFLLSLDNKRIDYIKCDVEGHELAVIRGGGKFN